MDMASPVGSNVILENRYALLECLAVSSVGKIYRGRDLEEIKEKGLESRVLIHVLPVTPNALPLDVMFQQMLEVCQQVGAGWILRPQAYGQDGGFAYFVLESPEKWGLFSLISRANSHDPVWQAAMQQLQPLVKKKYLGAGTDPALLLGVSKEEIYLLPTAFSPLVQMLGGRVGARGVTQHRKRKAIAAVGSAFALFTIFSAVASNAILHQGGATVVVEPAHAPARQAMAPARLVAIPANEMVDSPATGMQAALNGQVSLAGEQPLPPVMAQAQAEPEKTKPASAGVMQTAAASRPVPEQSWAENAREASAMVAEPATQLEASRPPDDADGLIQQAYAAMGAGRLDASNAGALHFVRQLRGLSPGHPQVARLGQEISAAYLRQVRVALQNGNLATAGQLLPVTRQLIQEFGLTNLEPAQQVLEEKVAQLNSY